MRAGLVIAAVLLVGHLARADSRTAVRMHTLPEEALRPAIHLPTCRGVNIIEWNPLPRYQAAEIKILNDACNEAVDAFPEFARREHLFLESNQPFSWNIVILPEDEEYRHLNDTSFRFSKRFNWIMPDGNPMLLKGYTDHLDRDIFIFNHILNSDVPNKRFITIYTHEMFHALSYHYHVYQSHSGDKNRADESLAIKFTKYLNLGI